MKSKYDPYENAITERVNRILKSEFDAGGVFVNPKHAHRVVNESIRINNQIRSHLSCYYRTPEEAHEKLNFKMKKWKITFYL